MAFVARPVPTEVTVSRDRFIERIEYNPPNLKLAIACNSTCKNVAVKFYGVMGFRVLDEGDLLEFWPECSWPSGWLFQIEDGGWYQQESARGGFLMPHFSGQIREYFVTGTSDCINVLMHEPVQIEILQEDNLPGNP